MKEISETGPRDGVAHRWGVFDCPHCKRELNWEGWGKAACELILDPRYYKAGCVAVVAECPFCFEKSWVHSPMECFEYASGGYPKEWRDAVEKRKQILLNINKKEWDRSLCKVCGKLEGKPHNLYNYWISCERGLGGPRVECELFKKKPQGSMDKVVTKKRRI